ncbi:Iron-sulfur clusters transporter ATM1, mitochondrial [Nosema granulosis]|uniref:Iron-sulfur clusters transporter ATM1, mitochondrial n=1 Tax=Nosema granulosis TaxID=83296 RepID=A0A9P6GXF7_9MICR|nr:Iron-sulfur clusters transporter ATM1, mitochondrial [Nosema granulosis]
MKKVNNTQKNMLKNVFFDYMLPNPYFKLTIVPIMLLIIVSGMFHNMIINAVTDIETVFKSKNDKKTPELMGALYLLTTSGHYLLVLLYEVLMGFYVQKNVVYSFKMHTYQYLMVNHNDFHKLGSGKAHSLIEKRTKAITELLEIFILNFYNGLSFIVTTNISLYGKFGFKLMMFNVSLFVVYAISCFAVAPFIDRFRTKSNRDYNEASNRIFGIIQNYDTIKSYNHDRNELESLDYYKLDSLEKSWCNTAIFLDIVKCAQNLLVVIPNGFVFYMALKRTGFNTIATFADLSIYNKMFMSLKNKIDTIGQDVVMLIEHGSNLNYDCIRGTEEDDTGQGESIPKFTEKIEFKDFGIEINSNILLQNTNFEIFKGEKVAIVGKNGTGKSTFMKTLLRFYKHQGEILIDGLDTSKLSVSSQRSLLAYIPQTPYMIEDSVLNNIKYSNSKISDTEIIELSKIYKTHRIFKTLEDGYLTNVGENGRFLSGGQKQQVSFLRAVVKNSDIFLIDEPTANLDHVAEADMIGTIFKQMPEKTVLVIIHSFQYLSKFDKILGFHNKGVNVYSSFEDFKPDMHLY